MVTESSGIVYLEIPAPDIKAAENFYRDVFGWKISAGMGDEYRTFEAGTICSGGLDANAKPVDSGVLIYLKVDDIESKLLEIVTCYGKIVQEKQAVGGDHGFFGLFLDPNGNRLGLWSES